jgi:hypothetical protein
LRGSNDQQTSSKTKEKRKKTEIINIRSEIWAITTDSAVMDN